MAEEAIGLAKSLSWTVELGPNFLSLPNAGEPINDSVDSTKLIPKKRGRKIGPNRYSVEGEELKNWDRVEAYGTGLTGFYWNGKMLLDLDFSDESNSDGDEWTNADLRNSIAASSIIKIRRPSSSQFFGRGKVKYKQLQEISNFIENHSITTLYINSILTALQQRNIER